ncbi:MAG: GIY-YIG nuclease family protein [Patescibacteria group bacterium]
MFYVYILQSISTRELYDGYTEDLQNRLHEHNRGLSYTTRHGKPWKLAYYEAYASKRDAMNRERQLKQYGQALSQLKRRLQYSLQ